MRAITIPLAAALLLSGCGESETTQLASHKSSISAPAELVSLKTASIGPPNVRRMWQFKIERMAPENTLVKQGDVILMFDGQRLKNDLIGRRSDLEAEKQRAQSQQLNDVAREQELVLALAEAEMNFEKARRKAEIVDASRSRIERDKQQADYRYFSENLAQAKQRLAHHRKAMVLNAKVAQGKIDTLQRKVDSIEADIRKLAVTAPKDGLVVYKTTWDGQKAAVGETVYMGRTLLELPSLDNIAIKAEFAEPDTAKLTEGQAVRVVFEAYPEMAFSGRIKSLGQAYYPKSANSSKVIFDAMIELTGEKPEVMRPGMKAKVEVDV